MSTASFTTLRPLASAYLGRVGYAEAERLQERLREALKAESLARSRRTPAEEGEPRDRQAVEALLLLEHPHVYTLGRNAPLGDLLASQAWLDERGIEVHECDRGGRVTYHGPGQLVGYPILDLGPDRRDVRRYVRDLQEVLIRTLADERVAGIEARGGETSDGIGVWVGEGTRERKIASIGVHLKRWITSHGFALNVTTDLSYFAGIQPCGFSSSVMTSIEQLTGRKVELEAVAERCALHFGEVFDRRMVPLDRAAALGAAAPPAAPVVEAAPR